MKTYKKYLCGITFQSELGYTEDISIYNSLEELKEKHDCYDECGAVEIEVEEGKKPEKWHIRTWLIKQNLNWGKSKKDYVSPEVEELSSDQEPDKEPGR